MSLWIFLYEKIQLGHLVRRIEEENFVSPIQKAKKLSGKWIVEES